MAKKGSLELGVNSIVILIIAMAVLGLIIFFIYNNLQPDIPELPDQPAAAPDSTNPITTSPPVLAEKGGQKINARINVFNTLADEATTVTLEMICDGTPNLITASAKNIPSYDYVEYVGIIEFPKKPSDKYLCTITAKDPDNNIVASQDIIVTIN